MSEHSASPGGKWWRFLLIWYELKQHGINQKNYSTLREDDGFFCCVQFTHIFDGFRNLFWKLVLHRPDCLKMFFLLNSRVHLFMILVCASSTDVLMLLWSLRTERLSSVLRYIIKNLGDCVSRIQDAEWKRANFVCISSAHKFWTSNLCPTICNLVCWWSHYCRSKFFNEALEMIQSV